MNESQSPSNHDTAKAGDLVELIGPNNKYFLFRLEADMRLETHRGVVEHNQLIGKKWGSLIHSHQGNPFYLFQPSLKSILLETKRTTQIMYPKDIGFILLSMNISPGVRVIEAGSGSGALTTALAYAVGENGKVYSYEKRPEMLALAKKNIHRLGLEDRVVFKLQDITSGFEENNVDALFLDLPNPYDFLPQSKEALKPGGFWGAILPTLNQVIRLLDALRQNFYTSVEVCEILLRHYKSISERLRPTDRMVAHTGYLIFARPVTKETFITMNAFEESDQFQI